MMQPRAFDRRSVLKTLGGGVVGGVLLTGRATATTDVTNGEIYLVDTDNYHDFDPDDAQVDADSFPATVDWVSESVASHNVVLETDDGTLLFTSQAFQKGGKYQVKFEDSGAEYRLTQTNEYGNAGGPASATVDSRDLPLTMRCSIHDVEQAGVTMRGTLDIDSGRGVR